MVPLKAEAQSLYDADYMQWLETTVIKLRSREYATVDWESLIEEIEDMGRSECRRLESNLIVVLLHLLKWQHQPEKRCGSWAGSLVEHRRRIRRAIEDSPSLKQHLAALMAASYKQAVKQAIAETGLPSELFSVECPYSLAEVLDDEWLP